MSNVDGIMIHERIRERTRSLNSDDIDSQRLRAFRQSSSAKKGISQKGAK